MNRYSPTYIHLYNLLKDADMTANILDVGCGTGSFLKYLASKGFINLYGYDIVNSDNGHNKDILQKKIDENLSEYPSLIGNINPIPYTEGSLPFPNVKFDYIFSNQVIEHVNNLEKLVFGLSERCHQNIIQFHCFPLKSIFIEPHLFVPIIHWFDKYNYRRIIYNFFNLFYGVSDSKIFDRISYLETNCFYRTRGQISKEFLKSFSSISFNHSFDLINAKHQFFPRIPKSIQSFFIPILGVLTSVTIKVTGLRK